MLTDIVERLACPHCAASLGLDERALVCERGHCFDVARQGYVSLIAGGGAVATGDSANMVAARESFLAGGHYVVLGEAITTEVAEVPALDCVAEIGAGTGYYLTKVLNSSGDALGVAIDASKAAARRAAHAHSRIGSVVADVWRGLPLQDGSVAVALVVFAPRSATELRRVLAPGGTLIVVTPTPRHLRELVADVGLLTVDERKPERLRDSMAATFVRTRRVLVEATMALRREEVRALVGMGPSAWHLDAATIDARIGALDDVTAVTLSAQLSVFRPLA